MAPSSAEALLWKKAFLTLRDETLSSLPPSSVLALLCCHILSHPSDALAAAAASLPPPEVTSDVLLLEELASVVLPCEDSAEPLLQILCLTYAVCCRVQLSLTHLRGL
ncbi:hypothetical protein HPP92_028753 [Vanilla planifolia]|uniref:Uncharacterized protein n=1 Tax=Vanilla planifolia TaxID=51239 RepID=A0A835U354_VANPL|nr:hypothetical protein HPP92_028753 [Vanilla planifolia]